MSCQLIQTANAAAKAVAPGTALSEPARRALMAAFDDETRAADRCAARVAELGEVAPFAKHLKAKRRRRAALAVMARAYGLDLPKAPGAMEDAAGPLHAEARLSTVAGGVADETARLARYERELIPAVVADAPELADVFRALAARTRTRHLPAFRRAVAEAGGVPDLRCGGNGPGPGQCRGHNHDEDNGRAAGGHDHPAHRTRGGGRCSHGHRHAHGH